MGLLRVPGSPDANMQVGSSVGGAWNYFSHGDITRNAAAKVAGARALRPGP